MKDEDQIKHAMTKNQHIKARILKNLTHQNECCYTWIFLIRNTKSFSVEKRDRHRFLFQENTAGKKMLAQGLSFLGWFPTTYSSLMGTCHPSKSRYQFSKQISYFSASLISTDHSCLIGLLTPSRMFWARNSPYWHGRFKVCRVPWQGTPEHCVPL